MVTVVWLDAVLAVVVVVTVALARIAVQIRLAVFAAEVALAVVEVLEVVGGVFAVEPNARKFLITTSSAAALGNSTSAPPDVMYGPTVGRVTAFKDPGGKPWNSRARLNIVPSDRVWSIVRL